MLIEKNIEKYILPIVAVGVVAWIVFGRRKKTNSNPELFLNAVSNQSIANAKCNCENKMYDSQMIDGGMYNVGYWLQKGYLKNVTVLNADGTIDYVMKMCQTNYNACGEQKYITLDPPVPTGGQIGGLKP